MTGYETNIFPITNLAELSSDYKLYQIKGLHPDQNEYYQNCQVLKRRLSYSLKKPVTVIERDGIPYLVIRADAAEPSSPFPLVRTAVTFERCPGTLKLDYNARKPQDDEICIRFLQFMLQAPLRSHPDLWQPGAGQPFFEKQATSTTGELLRFMGFSVRVTVTPSGGMGLCVDVTSKCVSANPLPTRISRDEFSMWDGRHAIYHYGHQWYEIQISGLDDRNVTEYMIQKDARWVHLLEYAAEDSEKPIPPELAQVPHDASVVLYRNNQEQERGAIASLCYPVFGTDVEEAGEQHASTILPPHVRRRMIHDFVSSYLVRLRFGDIQICVSPKPLAIQSRMFNVPDLKFGHSRVLSVRATQDTQHVSLDNLGSARLALLRDKEVGFYNVDPLDRQYFIMPQSVYESYGTRFLQDMRHAVDDLFPQKEGYDPVVVKYDDRGPKTFRFQGNAILKAVKAECQKPGYGIAMVHHTADRLIREEDQLAAMVIRELRQLDIYASVIHSAVGQECYELVSKGDKLRYEPRQSKRGKLAGYLRMVALNKVLLTNQRWPFVLATRLNADITIGIDVKHNTAGLVIVGSNGGDIRTLLKTSRQKERLLEEQLQSYLVEILRKESAARAESIRTIVIHRDGKIYPSELSGARQAMALLKQEGAISPEATLTVLEIQETSVVPLRLFDVVNKNGRSWIENPQIGFFHVANEVEGYLCSTGRAFPRSGTVRPLHVRHVGGPLPLEKCLEDVYYLTALAWTRPEDCTRSPITIKLNDRFLGEEATEYDADALDYVAVLAEEAMA